MAARKKITARKKPQYVRAKKRKGADSSFPKRSLAVILVMLIVVGALVGIRAGFGWIHEKLFSKNPRFEIQHLVISSDGHLTEDRIREHTGLCEGMNLFEVDFDEIEQALLIKEKRAESVYLERKLPHTLIIRLKERIPMARVAGKRVPRFPFLVDRYGYVLPTRRSDARLPVIKGLEDELLRSNRIAVADVETALKIIGLCESSGYLRNFIRIESLDIKYSDYIDMRLQGGIRVRMPRFSLKPKLQKLASVIKIETGRGLRVKEVDLTLDSAKVPVTYY